MDPRPSPSAPPALLLLEQARLRALHDAPDLILPRWYLLAVHTTGFERGPLAGSVAHARTGRVLVQHDEDATVVHGLFPDAVDGPDFRDLFTALAWAANREHLREWVCTQCDQHWHAVGVPVGCGVCASRGYEEVPTAPGTPAPFPTPLDRYCRRRACIALVVQNTDTYMQRGQDAGAVLHVEVMTSDDDVSTVEGCLFVHRAPDGALTLLSDAPARPTVWERGAALNAVRAGARGPSLGTDPRNGRRHALASYWPRSAFDHDYNTDAVLTALAYLDARSLA